MSPRNNFTQSAASINQVDFQIAQAELNGLGAEQFDTLRAAAIIVVNHLDRVVRATDTTIQQVQAYKEGRLDNPEFGPEATATDLSNWRLFTPETPEGTPREITSDTKPENVGTSAMAAFAYEPLARLAAARQILQSMDDNGFPVSSFILQAGLNLDGLINSADWAGYHVGQMAGVLAIKNVVDGANSPFDTERSVPNNSANFALNGFPNDFTVNGFVSVRTRAANAQQFLQLLFDIPPPEPPTPDTDMDNAQIGEGYFRQTQLTPEEQDSLRTAALVTLDMVNILEADAANFVPAILGVETHLRETAAEGTVSPNDLQDYSFLRKEPLFGAPHNDLERSEDPANVAAVTGVALISLMKNKAAVVRETIQDLDEQFGFGLAEFPAIVNPIIRALEIETLAEEAELLMKQAYGEVAIKGQLHGYDDDFSYSAEAFDHDGEFDPETEGASDPASLALASYSKLVEMQTKLGELKTFLEFYAMPQQAVNARVKAEANIAAKQDAALAPGTQGQGFRDMTIDPVTEATEPDAGIDPEAEVENQTLAPAAVTLG